MSTAEKIVRIECKGATVIDVMHLAEFQGNLKDLTETNYLKLKRLILELGYSEPVSVWIQRFPDEPGNKFTYQLLNGHQRVRTLQKMIEEGYEVPPIPVNLVEASDVETAKRKVLALTSQFGEITRQGLYEFVEEAGLDAGTLQDSFRFPEIDLPMFHQEFYGEPAAEEEKQGAKEMAKFEFSKFDHKCPRCQFEFNDDKQ